MTGKEYLDKEYGGPRGNGNGMANILDDFAKKKVQKDLIPELEHIKERASVEYVKSLLQELIDKYK